MFSEKVCEELGHYVYRLIDPCNKKTFYVGKGVGNRVFHHALASQQLELAGKENEINAKLDRIRKIIGSGKKVQHIIHRHKIPTEEAAFEVEAALIDAYAELTNIQGGHGSSARGPMCYTDIVKKFDLPKLVEEPPHKLLLININNYEGNESDKLYNQVRFCWRIDAKRAKKAEYVLAVVRGVVRGVFIVDEWMRATSENFKDFDFVDENSKRYGFVGKVAPAEIWKMYVGELGKQINNKEMEHIQNPIRYYKI